MRSLLFTAICSLMLGACAASSSSTGDADENAAAVSAVPADVKSALDKSCDPNAPPAAFTGQVPGADASRAAASYGNDNFVATYKVRAANQDVYVVLGNVVDADFEMAVFDRKGALVASATYFGFQGAKWIWDAKAQTATHTGGGAGTEAVKAELEKSFDPNKPPKELKGALPGSKAREATASYKNDNYVAEYKLEVANNDIYVVLGNVIDADFEIAVFDSEGALVASATYFGFQSAKWIWDTKAQTKSHTH